MELMTMLMEKGEDHVGVITLNQPKTLNTFTSQTAGDLLEALSDMDRDKKVRVVLIKANGKAFCAGIDVNELEGKDANQYQAWVEAMEAPLVFMSRMRKPVITQVQGVAAANGAGLVAASDLCIASEKARFGFTAVNVGLFCLGPAVPLVRMLGRKRAFELLFFGELISSQTALELGLINRVVPPGDLDEQASAWAAKLATKSPLSVQLSKQAFYQTADMEYEKAFAFMNEAFARLCSTHDAKEGVAAFLEKRKPQWRER